MVENIRVIIATIALILALFSFFVNIPMLLPYVFILFGIDEIKERQKAKAFVYFLGSVFVLYVGVSSIVS
ncbi:YczI family protein [Bacillus sp. Brlt_9]|uniref:YczI family protein n=1 Tax=Bacillus sp. Brlt_9 TaxID=3110916 RepID=UPI003F7BDF03